MRLSHMRHFGECDLGCGPLLGEGRPFWCSHPESCDFQGSSVLREFISEPLPNWREVHWSLCDLTFPAG